jgi:hypothetical protein
MAVSAPVFGQFSAAIQGVVSDTTGGVLPGATVSIRSTETGRTLNSVTGDEGFYRIGGLAPGIYSLTVEMPGFQKKMIENVRITAEDVAGLNVRLDAAGVDQTITVTSDALATARTENPDIGRSLTSGEVSRLPQFGRDPYELTRLTPGIFGSGARGSNGGVAGLPNAVGPGGSATSIFAVENQVQVSAVGQRISSNNFQLDGVNINSLTWGGAAVVTPNQESVKEMRVLSSSYSAEDGRNSGAHIKVVSKSGTNTLHGSAFFKFQDPALNAFNRYGGPGAPPIRVSRRFRQFGGSVGGPVLTDRLFYFFSYEGLRSKDTDFVNRFVETPEFREQLTTLRPNGISSMVLRTPGVVPRIAQVVATYCSIFGNDPSRCQVVPGGLDIGSITGELGQYVSLANPTGGGLDGVPDIQFARFTLPQRISGDQLNSRVDFDQGNHHFALSTYFTMRDDEQTDAGSGGRPMADLTFQPLNTAVTLLWNSVWTPTLLNEARANFTRFAYDQLKSSEETNFGIPRVEVEGYPFDRIRFGAPRAETTPGVFAQNTFGAGNIISTIRANHAIRLGTELHWEHNNNNLLGGARPIYSFAGLFNLANDTPIFQGINADPATGRPIDLQRYFRSTDYAFFVHDDWKLRSNLTLNLGLRYEYFGPLAEKEGRISNLVFGSQGLADSRVEITDQLYQPDRNNFGPRLGFAWSPLPPAHQVVLRGGFAIYYNRIPTVVFNNVRGNPPFFARYNLCCGTAEQDFGTPYADNQILYSLGASRSPFSYPANPALAPGIDPETGGPRGVQTEIYGAEKEIPNPYVYVFSLELEYLLPANWVAAVAYQGSAGHKLMRTVNLNFLYPANPGFFAVYFPLPDINTNYHGSNFRLGREFSDGFRFDATYRFSKSIDAGSGEFGGATNQTYPIDLGSERGPSDFDARHYLVLSGLWDLPFFSNRNDWLGFLLGGWQFNGIFTGHSGFPWTPKTGRALSIPALAPTRPTGFLGQPLSERSDEAFMRPGGNFPGGGRLYFDIENQGPPGIGRNSFRGPSYSSADFSLVKQFTLSKVLGEQGGLEIRANFFNAFNSLNLEAFSFSSPGTFVEDDFFFGRSERGLAGRVIELQARFDF